MSGPASIIEHYWEKCAADGAANSFPRHDSDAEMKEEDAYIFEAPGNGTSLQGSNDVEAKRGTSGHAENNRAWLLSQIAQEWL